MSLKLGTTDISGVPTTLINTVNNKLDASTYTSNPRTNAVYITQTYHSGSSWYRVWSDGFIEQGGNVSSSSITQNVSISFLKNFSSTNYVVVATSVSPTSYSSNTSNASRNFVIEWASTLCLKGQSGISRCRTNDGSYSWYACGY